MALSGSFNTSGYYDSASPYYLTFSWTATQSVADNTSTVTWSVKAYGGVSSGYYNTLFQRYTKVGSTTKQTDINSPGTQTVYNGTVVYSGTETISHASDGTGSFTAEVKASFEAWNSSYNSTGSATFTLDTIPRAATITSADNFTDQTSPVLKYSNTAGTSATLQAGISLDSSGSTWACAYRSVTNTASSYTFSLTSAEKTTLLNNTTSGSRTVYFWLKTTIGSNVYTASVAKTFTVDKNASANKPSVSVSASIDNSNIPSTYRSQFASVYVQNFSKASVTVTASGKNNATITGYSSSLAGSTYSGQNFTSNVLQTAGSLALTSTVTDSRGITNSATQNLTVYSYTNPSLSGISVFRSNSSGTASDSGTYIKIAATKVFASVNSINKAILRYRYKVSTSSSYSSWITLLDYSSSSNAYSGVRSDISFAVTNAYNIQLSILDYLGKETIYSYDIPTETVTLHLKDGGKAVGIGTYAGADSTVTSAWGFTASAGSITAPAGSVVAGTDGSTAAERQVEVRSGAGRMYMFSQASTTGVRGLYLPAHGSGAAKSAISVDTNNNVTFNGSLSGNATSATSATKATQDGDGLTISTGYIKRVRAYFGDRDNTSATVTGWWKVATGSITGYGNHNLVWLVKDNYARTTGILVLEIRGNGSSNVVPWTFSFMTKIGFANSHFCLNYSGATWTLYVYRNNAYGRISFTELEQADINGSNANYVTYYNDTFYGTAVPTTGTNVYPTGFQTNVATSYTSTVTRSSGATIASQSLETWGKVARLTLQLTASGTYYTGGVVFQGTLESGYRPSAVVTGVGMIDYNNSNSGSFAGIIETGGTIRCRATTNLTLAGTVYISFTYLLA